MKLVRQLTTRSLSKHERQILELLLAEPFDGVVELRQQAELARVEKLDAEGSLSFVVPASLPAAKVAKRIPVEAEAPDADGIMVHALLHVVDGRLSELEIYKDDSSGIRAFPPISSWDVMLLKSSRT